MKTERTIQLLGQQSPSEQAMPCPASAKRKRATPAAGSRARGPQSATGEETTEMDMEVLEDNLGDGSVSFQSSNIDFVPNISR
jgi:hypothetical protein